MRNCGGHVGIAGTAEHTKMFIGGVGGMEVAKRRGESESFNGEAVHKIGGGVKGFQPINRGKTGLKQ